MIRHFTATAFIVNSRKETLLLWHNRVQRWMPPGGHIEENETPQEAAKRECKEETGLDVRIEGREQNDLFEGNREEGHMLVSPLAMLLEYIPPYPKRNEGAHEHMDFLFLARPIDESQDIAFLEEESQDIRWFTKSDIEKMDENTEIYANVKAYILSIL